MSSGSSNQGVTGGAGDTHSANLSERLLSRFWDNTADYACILLNLEGSIVGWKGAASHMLGFSEEDIVGKPIAAIFTEEDRQLGQPQLEREMAMANGRAEDDRWHVRKDGARIWISGALLAMREDGAVIGFAKVMQDRTDLKAQIESLRSRNAYLERSVTGRDETFAKVTHEIRNALAPIRNAAVLLSMQVDAGQATLAHAILDRQLAIIESMARDLSEAARISVGKLHLNREPLDVGKELLEIVAVARPRAAEKRQDILVFVSEGPVIVFADRRRFHQIVFNLLDNAVKYTGERGHIWVKCIVEEAEVVIRIEDDGVGISASLLPVIFDLFTQETPDHPEGGMGIGLGLVKSLVEAHGGRMEVRSEGKGKGSEFAVRLPLLTPATTA
jgi:PAS domain S-box-containing protein